MIRRVMSLEYVWFCWHSGTKLISYTMYTSIEYRSDILSYLMFNADNYCSSLIEARSTNIMISNFNIKLLGIMYI